MSIDAETLYGLVEDRLKMARLCESLSGLAALTPMLSVIAAGPPATQRLNFRLMKDLDHDRKAAKMARIAREFGIEPATPDGAGKILGLKGVAQVNY